MHDSKANLQKDLRIFTQQIVNIHIHCSEERGEFPQTRKLVFSSAHLLLLANGLMDSVFYGMTSFTFGL